MMPPVLHDALPFAPWTDPVAWRLPGVGPVEIGDWLLRDEVFAQQMALRDRLIADQSQAVHACLPQALGAARECLGLVLSVLAHDDGYSVGKSTVIRPDGVKVALDRDQPLLTLGRLVQEDICLMEAGPDGHVLTGAILCFPASWTLSEKIGRPLSTIHRPVPEYAGVAPRVQRLFDAIRPGHILGRANAVRHHDPSLFHPRSETDPPDIRHGAPGGPFVRSERQTLRRLPDSGAVVFAIHTYVVPIERLTNDQRSAMESAALKSG